MIRNVFSSVCAFTIVIISLLSICMISGTSAALVTGSENTGYLSASGGGYTINIQVDYAVYDGTSADDPLGITIGDLQIGFDLIHLGAETGHESDTVLNLKRFIVHGLSENFYTNYGYDSDSDGEVAPADPYGYAVAYDGEDVFFNFYDYIYEGILTPAPASDTSKTLAVAMPAENLPETLIIETDELYSIGETNTEINIVPEPTSTALFGVAVCLLTLRRRRKK